MRFNRTHKRLLIAAAAGLISGAGLGTLVTSIVVGKKANQKIEKEVNEFKAEYGQRMTKKLEAEKEHILQKVEEEAEEILDEAEALVAERKIENQKVKYNQVVKEYMEEPEVESETKNVFDDPEPTITDPDHPYVISFEEFMADEPEYTKVNVTYFEEDDCLCDDREEILPDIEGTVGSDALTRFGFRSDSRDIVYVRNEKMGVDFEVARDPRSYQEIVMGIRPEGKKIRKMRDDD